MAETWTTLKVLTWTADKLSSRGIASGRLDAEVLLARVLGVPRVALYTGFDRPLQASELAAYRDLIRRRLAGEPVAYLVGEQEFWSLPLTVDARVLVPRRDTETLVEEALRAARLGARDKRLLDVATGSGAIAIALAHELPEATITASDVSPGALAVARQNLMRHGLVDRVRLIETDLCHGLEGPFDVVVSNPPYVPSVEIDRLSAEVRCEPRAALDGGPDGLALLRRLIPAAVALLAPGGTLAVEHGHDQGARTRSLFVEAGLAEAATVKDLAGNDRVTRGSKR